jgi:hypothetical protein
MVVRVPQASIANLRALVEEHLRQEYSWPGGESLEDIDIFDMDFVEFLYAALALDYSRDAHPWMGRGGATVDNAEGARIPANVDMLKTLVNLDPRTPEAVLAALVDTVPLEIVDARSGRRAAAPRVYPHYPRSFPDTLGPLWLATVFGVENVFGVVGEAGWLLDRGKDLDKDELRDPYAHGAQVYLETNGMCAGGSLLAVLVSDGRHVARLEELWDRWAE